MVCVWRNGKEPARIDAKSPASTREAGLHFVERVRLPGRTAAVPRGTVESPLRSPIASSTPQVSRDYPRPFWRLRMKRWDGAESAACGSFTSPDVSAHFAPKRLYHLRLCGCEDHATLPYTQAMALSSGSFTPLACEYVFHRYQLVSIALRIDANIDRTHA